MTSETSQSAVFDEEDYLRVEPAAKYLKVGARWLRDGVNHHGFPHHRLGRLLIFSKDDLTQIADMHRARPNPIRRRRGTRARSQSTKS